MLRNALSSAKIFRTMKGLYLLLDGITLFFPLILSFDSKVHYISSWRNVFIASSVIAIPFLLWDVFFTANGIWGFNQDYLVGISIAGLPIEEILFFWVVPFSCVFIYECTKYYFRNSDWGMLNKSIQIIMVLYVLLLVIVHDSGWYTLSIVITTSLIIALWKWKWPLPFLGIAFLLSLLPFLVVNGILTGSFLEAPIVWYNDAHNAGVRIFTIPAEDIAYSFSLIAGNILLLEVLNTRSSKKAHPFPKNQLS